MQVTVSPAAAVLIEGDEVHLSVSVRDQVGRPFYDHGVIRYSSSAPGVAEVDATGRIRAIAPGSARVSARVTSGSSSLSGDMVIQVFGPAQDGAVLVSGSAGWQPASVRVKSGSVVTWVAGPVSWSGASNRILRLLDDDHHAYDSLDLSSGTASLRVGGGTLRYCSGGCGDARDFGEIYIH